MPEQLQDFGAEQFILGLVISTGRLEYFGDLREVDFAAEPHRVLWHACHELADQGKPIDQLTVFEWLESKDSKHVVNRAYVGTTADAGLSLSHRDPTDEHIQFQIRLLHDFAKQRQSSLSVRKLTIELGDATDLQKAAQKAAAIVEEVAALEKPKRAIAIECPQLPESAWHGLARRYRDLIGPCTEAPDNFHLGCFITCVGGALGRSVFFQMPESVFPNFFLVLVGVSSDPRKGTAMAKASRLVNAVFPSLYVLRSIDSAEGFAEKLQTVQDPESKSYRPALVKLTELRSLLDKAAREGARNIMPRLCDAYDGETIEVNTRHASIRVEEPAVAVMAGTSKAYMRGLRKEDLEGGLGNRLVYIPGEPKTRIPEPPDPTEPAYGELVAEISDILKYWHDQGRTRFELTPAARKLWNPFYMELPRNGHFEDPLLGVLAGRDHHHAIKFAMVSAALDRTRLIDAKHIGAAIVWQEFLLRARWYIFAEFGIAPWVEEERRIVDAVRKAGALGIRRRRLQTLMWKMGAETFNRRMKWLTAVEGPLAEEQRGRAVWVVPND